LGVLLKKRRVGWHRILNVPVVLPLRACKAIKGGESRHCSEGAAIPGRRTQQAPGKKLGTQEAEGGWRCSAS